MKIVALRTYSLSCDPILEPIAKLGHDLHQVTYHNPGHPCDFDALPDIEADLVVMLGQNDDGSGQHVPSVEVLREISERRPLVHICCDGSETVWWPQLESYALRAPRVMHVNIDGVPNGFFDGGHKDGVVRWTTLCPLDHEPFEAHALAWDKRPHMIGFCGGWGVNHPRGDFISGMIENRNDLVRFEKRPYPGYDGYRAFLGQCRAVLNHAATGTADHMHVKARVLEAMYAGALVIEQEGAPTARYFDPYDDFYVWRETMAWSDLREIKRSMEDRSTRARSIVHRVRDKAIELYSAQRFWPRVFAMAGVA